MSSILAKGWFGDWLQLGPTDKTKSRVPLDIEYGDLLHDDAMAEETQDAISRMLEICVGLEARNRARNDAPETRAHLACHRWVNGKDPLTTSRDDQVAFVETTHQREVRENVALILDPVGFFRR